VRCRRGKNRKSTRHGTKPHCCKYLAVQHARTYSKNTRRAACRLCKPEGVAIVGRKLRCFSLPAGRKWQMTRLIFIMLILLLACTTQFKPTPPPAASNGQKVPPTTSVNIACDIFSDKSLNVVATNPTDARYNCNVTCNTTTVQGNNHVYQCNPTVDPEEYNTVVCDDSGISYARVISTSFNCH
jgi:hypothetical protein